MKSDHVPKTNHDALALGREQGMVRVVSVVRVVRVMVVGGGGVGFPQSVD